MSAHIFNPSMSYMHGADGTLTLTVRPTMDETDTIVVTFAPLAVVDVASSIAREAGYAIEAAMRQLLRGQCSTCNNYRMVDKPRHGRPWHEHCPDCGVNEAAEMAAVVPVLADTVGAFGDLK